LFDTFYLHPYYNWWWCRYLALDAPIWKCKKSRESKIKNNPNKKKRERIFAARVREKESKKKEKKNELYFRFLTIMKLFFVFYQNGICFKKITNLAKSCQFSRISYAQIVSIRHDSTMSYWSRANLARLLSCHTEVVPTWHDFCLVILKSCQLGTNSATS